MGGPKSGELPAEIAQALEDLRKLDDEALWRAAQERFSEDAAARLEELNLKQQREGLRPEEKQTLAQLLEGCDRVMAMRSEAAWLLKQRGHDLLTADRRAPRLSQAESELLEKINRGLAAQDQHRYEALVAQVEIEDLTRDENAEFLRLTSLLEALNAERMEALAELARLRRSTLRELMQDLGIKTPADA